MKMRRGLWPISEGRRQWENGSDDTEAAKRQEGLWKVTLDAEGGTGARIDENKCRNDDGRERVTGEAMRARRGQREGMVACGR